MSHSNRVRKYFRRETLCAVKIVLDIESNISHSSNMPRGRQTRVLRPEQIKPLHALRVEKRWTYQQLKVGIGAPCTAETLKSAMDGNAIWDVYHSFLASWVERWLGVPIIPVVPQDGKAAAAGNDGQKDEREAQQGAEAAAIDPTATRHGR